VALIWIGCSVEKDYKVLSFFFDGVPDPTIVRSNADAIRFAKETGGTVYTHAPFANNQCGECHKDLSGETARKVDPTLCFRCHESTANEYPKMHGAVSGGACVFCHSPHESTIKHLLRSRAPGICVQCHEAKSFGNPRAPVHQDLARDCLECHYAHGGPERFFLRDGWFESMPQQPAADGPSPPSPPSEPPSGL
jgi:predicted CXXCH cytochrome family protein